MQATASWTTSVSLWTTITCRSTALLIRYAPHILISIQDVEQGTQKMNASIDTSQKALSQSIEDVEAAYETFDNIISAAGGADRVQQQISDAAGAAEKELTEVGRSFEHIDGQFQQAFSHINKMSELGTTKSTMFESMDNMMSQIAPMVAEMEK